MISVGSVCSGAGGMDLGFHRAGFRTRWMCEWDPWRRELLARNFPGVPCHPDLREFHPTEHVDVLIGGTPCQDLSVAGRRAGLDGERSGLFWDYMRIRNALGIRWAVWENVAGALSSADGLDFACVLGAFVGADVAVPDGGWPGAGVVAGPWGGAVYRVLDAQHFGVPQRRRRVFVVGHLGGPCPPEVLLEPSSGSRDSQTRRGARQGTASPLEDGTGIARTLSTSNQRIDADTESFVVNALDRQGGGPDDNSAQGNLARRVDGAAMTIKLGHTAANGSNIMNDAAPALGQDSGRIATFVKKHGANHAEDYEPWGESDIARALSPFDVGRDGRSSTLVVGGQPAGASAFDPLPDGRRYAACGDGVVASVAEWIGERLMETMAGVADEALGLARKQETR